MLVLPTDPKWKDGPPESIDQFLKFLSGQLGGSWTLKLNAYDNAVPDDFVNISAEVQASYKDLQVSVTRHGCFDTVLVRLRGESRSIPFEDLAAVCGWTHKAKVLALANKTPDPSKPLVPLNKALRTLNRSRDDLITQLKSSDFRARLDRFSDEFAQRLFRHSRGSER